MKKCALKKIYLSGFHSSNKIPRDWEEKTRISEMTWRSYNDGTRYICSRRRVSRAATDDESDARHSNETGVKKKHEKTRKEAYAQSRTRSVWLNRIMTRCLITNYAAYATTDSVVAHRDYVTLTWTSRPVIRSFFVNILTICRLSTQIL